MYPPQNNGSPAGTPPLQVQGPLSTGTLSNESSPMSDKSGDVPPQFVQHIQQQQQQQYGEMRGYHDNKLYQPGDVKLSTEYMLPGRVIQEDRGEFTTANGKRLPIFNQLSDPVC